MGSSDESWYTNRLMPGTVFGRYRIERKVGSGGMGSVYEAVHVNLSKRVALKILHPWMADEPQIRSRFLLEGKAAARVRHPNVVDVYDVGEEDGLTYLVMEFLDGRELHEVLESRGRLTAAEIADVLVPIASALDAAHRCGLVHRDVKPSNIFLAEGRSGEIVPKLLDFGVSKIDEQEFDKEVTRGSVLGTPHYMAPEQAFGSSQIDARCDQFALGVIAYQCATGRLPFEASSLYQVLNMVMAAECVAPGAVDSDIRPEFETIIRTAMAKNPEDRYPSTIEFARALLDVAHPRLAIIWRPTLEAALPANRDTSPLSLLPPPTWAVEAQTPGAGWCTLLNEWLAPIRSCFDVRRLASFNLRAALSFAVLVVVMGGSLLALEGMSSRSVAAVQRMAGRYRLSMFVQTQDTVVELDGQPVGSEVFEIDLPRDRSVHTLKISTSKGASTKIVFSDGGAEIEEREPPLSQETQRPEVVVSMASRYRYSRNRLD